MALPFLGSEEFDEQAQWLHEVGDDDRALELLREGLSRFPDAVELHVDLGYVRLAREEYAWALRSFARALALEPDHEDAWAGRGETLLKFGRYGDALAAFAHLDELGFGDDAELGLAAGRALYREGLFHEARERLTRLLTAHPTSADALAALAYTLHALGDGTGARWMLRRALRCEPDFHEARLYLGHLLLENGDPEAALRHLERVPPGEHWEPASVWCVIDLKRALHAVPEAAAELAPWRRRLLEIEREPDGIDHVLAEVEAAFECSGAPRSEARTQSPERRLLGALLSRPQNPPEGAPHRSTAPEHRVRTREGEVLEGSWEEIVRGMRDAASDPSEPVALFMFRTAQRVRRLTGLHLRYDDAETFVRDSERAELLRIEF